MLPLLGASEVVGLLVACRFEPDTAPISDHEQALLVSLAERAAWAVEHDRMREELGRRADQQAGIAMLSRLALSGADEDALLEALITTLGDLLEADAVGWLEPASEPGTVLARAGSGWGEGLVHDGRVLPVVPGGPVEHALRHSGPVIVHDHLEDHRFSPSTALTDSGIRSSLLTAIGSPLLGIVGAHSRLIGAFSTEDAELMAAAAGVVSAAVARGRAEAEVHRLAYCDAVTGLPNRLALTEAVEDALAGGDRTALLLMDLDRFKQVNDTLGHAVGDRLLREVGTRIRAALAPGGLVARLGGDEFAIVMPGATGPEAIAAASRVARALRRPIGLDGIDLVADASIGIALAPAHGRTGTALLQAADIAMYRAKRNDQAWSTATTEDSSGDAERLELAAELRRAIDGGRLRLLYQPQLDVATGRVRGVEALIRWEHPRLGLLHPESFVELADHGGMASRLTWWVVAEVLNQAAAWREDGIDLPVAVNVPARVLHEPQLPERLADAVRELGLPAAALTVEMAEQATMSSSPTVIENVNGLGDLGVRVSVDDFGTGYSSAAHLQQLRVHEVKIDRTLISRLREGPTHRTTVRALCQLGRTLGLQVVAEGVESAGDLPELATLGVEVAQGFAISPPLPAGEFAELAARAAT